MDDEEADTEADTEMEAGLSQLLPEIRRGEIYKINSVKVGAGKTKPPARYTEATLLSAMEHPGKLIANQRLREVLEDSRGLGTPATRAEIIEKLFNSFYMERRGKEIIPTSKGRQLIELVPPELKSPELTAKWEQQLVEISKGRANREAFVKGIRSYARELVAAVTGSQQSYRHDNLTRTKCPDCGKLLLQVRGSGEKC